jgi:hypothetical protein
MEELPRRRHCIVQQESRSIQQVTRIYLLIFFLIIFALSGNVYIGDSGNHRVRKVTVSTGIITTIAGTGTNSYSGDGGLATSAALYQPNGVAVDPSGASH